MQRITMFIKKTIIVVLVFAITISVMQHHNFITFAANIAEYGPYLDRDVTKQIGSTDIIKNTPENVVDQPDREIGDYESSTPYDALKEAGWIEIIEKRTVDSKTFENEATGEQRTFMYMGAIHYFDEDEQWQEYDTDLISKGNSLSRSANTTYHETKGDVDINIPGVISDTSPIVVGFDDVNIDITTSTTLQNPQINHNVATYQSDGNQDTQVINIGGGLTINEKFYYEMPEEIIYTYSVNDGYLLYTNESKTIVAIVKAEDNQLVGAIQAPKAVDANKNPYTAGTTIEAIPTEEKNTYTLKIGLRDVMNNDAPAAYPINVSTSTATISKGTVQIYAINNYKPDVTYGPGGNGLYDDMFLIGDNSATPIYFPMGIFKAFVTTGVSSWQSYIGQDREITNAKLHVFEFTHQGAIYPDRSEIKVLRIENDYQGRPNSVTWNKWIASNTNLTAISSTWASKYDDDFVHFDITGAVSDWYGGAPDYGLLLDTTRDDEGLIFLNHDWSNSYLSGFGGVDGRPYIEISHKKAEPVDPNLSLDKTTVTIRPFTTSEQGGTIHFQALGFDGISRPGTVVDVQVYEVNNASNVVYNSTAFAISGLRQYPYYEPPIYPTIEKSQTYYGLSSNYQALQLLPSTNLQKDVLYQVKVRSNTLNDNGSIKETGAWITGDTFQVYSVKGLDHLPRIINFYGLTDKILLMKDNHMRDELVVENNEIFIRNPNKNQGKAYIGSELSEADKKNIDGYLMGQGKHCEFGYEPVNFNTGNFYYQNKDASFVEYGDEIGIERHYNSMAGGSESIFGRNWEFNWNKHITFLENGDIFYFDGTGKRIKFTKQGDGSYEAQGGEVLNLTRNQVGTVPYTQDNAYYDTVDDAPKQSTIQIPQYKYVLEDKEGKVYTFNVTGLLENIKIDRYENYMQFIYNEAGNLSKITLPSNKNVTLEYNNDGYVNKMILPDGNSLQYEYDDAGNLTAFKDQEGFKLEYIYNDDNNEYLMTSYKSRGDKTTIIQNTYDQKGRVVKQVDAKGDTASFKYYEDRTEITDFNGEKQVVYIDEQKRTTKVVNTDGSIKKQKYDDNNNLVSDESAYDSPINYTYDNRGNILSETRADGAIKTYVYNNQDLPVSITDFNGTTVTSEYDGYGNQTAVHYPDGSNKHFTYDEHGQLLQEVDRNGNTKNYMYENGNKVSETDGHGTKTYTYDAMGRLLSEVDASHNTYTFSRNSRGELLSISKPNGTTQYQYNADGEKVWEKDPNGNEKVYTYDVWSRLTSVSDSYGTIKYEYDSYGNVLMFIDELGNVTTYEYDIGNRKTKTNYPDGTTETYAYDSRGRLIEIIDPLGNSTTYEYDDIFNHIVKMTNAKGESTELIYDILGNLIETKYPDGTSEVNIYNDQNQMIESINRAGIKTKYTYDSKGNKLETVIGEHTQSSEFGSDDVETTRVDALQQSETITYTPTKLIDTVIMKNGSTLQYGYDGEYNITSIIDGAGNATTRKYDGNGNMINETDSLGNVTTYTYTARNQIATITYPDEGIEQFVYDAAGNEIEIVDPLGNVTKKEYDAMHNEVTTIDPKGNITTKEYNQKGLLIKTIDALDQETTYIYDEIGNMIEKEEPTGLITHYQYDEANRIIEVKDNFDRYTRNSYDAMGNIIKQENWKQEAITYSYDDYGNMISSTDIRGNIETYTYDANNQLLTKLDSKENKTEYTRNPIGQPITTIEGEKVINDVYNNIGKIIESQDQDGNQTTFTYDGAGHMTSITLPNGGTQTTTYTSMGLEETITDPNGGITENIYDKKGQLIAIIDPEGNKTQYEYDENGNQTMVIDPLGFAVIYEYDALNRVITITDKNENMTELTYNAWDQIVLSETTLGTRESKYNEKGQLIENIDPNGNVTTYAYNEFDQLIDTSQANGYIETNHYNEYGDVVEVTNNQDDTPSEQNVYDNHGQLITTTNSSGNTTTYEYDKEHLVKITAANGNTISYTYDTNDRIASMVDIRGNETKYQYDALDQVIAIKYPGDKEYTYTYDNNGNLLSEVDPMQAKTAYEYNKNNQQTAITNALGVTTSMTYDERGNAASITDGNGNMVSYNYDPNGNITEVIDPLKNTTSYQYDESNRIQTVRDRKDVETSYVYDANGNVTQIEAGNGATTTFTYDSMNQVATVKTADGNKREYSYDLKGNLSEETIPDGRSITYKYDALNNMVYQGYDDEEYQYRYNEDNQVVEVKDTKSNCTLTYNPYGDLISYSDGEGNVVSYEYDETGRKTGIIYPDGTKTSYAYDTNDRLIEVRVGDDITTYQYDVLGNKIEMVLPNGNTTIYAYDANNQLTKLESTTPTGIVLTSMEYVYDVIGNISKSKEEIEGVTTTKEYTYDEEERLVTSKHSSEGVEKEYTYTYDRAGNKVSVEEVINGKKTRTQYEFDTNNAVVVEDGEMDVDYIYDANGNVSEKRYASGVVENYSYDAKGQVIEVQSSKGKTITYSYDGFGNRVEKQEITTITKSEGSNDVEYFTSDGSINEEYDQQLSVATTDEKLENLKKSIEEHSKTYDQTCKSQALDEGKSSTKTIRYINDINREYTEVLQTQNSDGKTIDTYIYGNERINFQDTKETSYYSYDGRGSVVGQVTNHNPEELSYQIRYDDYGKTNRKMDDNYGYNGEAHDYNHSQYLRARYYDTNTGTFQQQDSYLGELDNPITQNRYSYVHNNPINLEDPSGHRMLDADGDRDREEILRIYSIHINTDNPISYDEAESRYLSKASPKTQQNYQKKVKEAEERVKQSNIDYQRKDVESWTDEAGKIGKKYLDSLLANGLSWETAYLLALQIKNICDQLDSEQLGMVKKHVDAMDVNSTELIDFFGWRQYTSEGNYRDATEGTSQVLIYSYFTNFLNTNRSTQQEINSWLMVAGVLLTAVTIGAVVYESMMLLALATGDFATYYQMKDLPNFIFGNQSSVSTSTVNGAKIDETRIGDMTKEQIKNSVPDTWEIHDNNGFVHIKDEIGRTIIEIHPPDGVTNYEHIHIYDELGNSLDINGVPRFYKDIEVHIPLKRD